MPKSAMVPESRAQPMRREIELDFIRGLAILLVMDFHAPRSLLLAPFLRLGWPHFGWAGVDVFFVLSGFLVGGLLVKEWRLRGSIDSRRFLVRRGLKIWPQYYVFLLAVLVSGHRPWRSLWGNLLNIQNYTGGVAHTWTLAVEEHAYLLLVAVLAFAAARHLAMRQIFAGLCGLAALVLGWRFWLAFEGKDVFLRTDTRLDGIVYGVLLAMLYHAVPAIFRKMQDLRWLWVAVLLAGLAVLRWQSSAWWYASLCYFCADMIGVATLLLLYRRRGQTRNVLYRGIAWVGLYSYGIYLWHVSVIEPIVGVAHRLSRVPAEILLAGAPMVAGILVGVVTTRLIEFPALRLRDRLYPRPVDAASGIPAALEAATGQEAVPEYVLQG